MRKMIGLKANARLENMYVQISAKEAIERIMDILGHGEIYGEKPFVSNGAIYVHEDYTGRGEHYRTRLVTRDKDKVEELKALLLIKDRIESIEKLEEITNKREPIYDSEQIEQIHLGLKNKIDIDKYANPKFNFNQMREIRVGLENGVDVSPYITPEFNYMQIRVIAKGLEKNVDVSSYAKLKNDWKTMESILNKLEDNLEDEDDLELEP
ncbi:hypothetical protein DW1_2108 [Proteiniborus sp. DW1]|uniref:hypothetical protein n=1 Tax=Proteiniborus sp. DW1 TaxID=1889883 RepID=UPI00092E16EF|nr:hypothetical protein [Proteiniborus sp. DW1]SCG83674.1 hypothetical protein DW1_2108 [Proteiniborus sp. DW1]